MKIAIRAMKGNIEKPFVVDSDTFYNVEEVVKFIRLHNNGRNRFVFKVWDTPKSREIQDEILRRSF